MLTYEKDNRIDVFCKKMIQQRWGQHNHLPEKLAQHVYRTTREFIISYLNILRQKESQPEDWFPDSLVIDSGLVNEMRHFFSDHQHITRDFLKLDRQLTELGRIDREKQPGIYQYELAKILSQMSR
jgi:hypothetical protein